MPSLALAPVPPKGLPPSPAHSALRAEVSKWLDSTTIAHVTRFGRIYPGSGRYVCIGGDRQGVCFALYFFHHGAHDWRTYPPRGIGPSIVYWRGEAASA
jgi:hypothetical protein